MGSRDLLRALCFVICGTAWCLTAYPTPMDCFNISIWDHAQAQALNFSVELPFDAEQSDTSYSIEAPSSLNADLPSLLPLTCRATAPYLVVGTVTEGGTTHRIGVYACQSQNVAVLFFS